MTTHTPPPWPCGDELSARRPKQDESGARYILVPAADYAWARACVHALHAAGITRPEGIAKLANVCVAILGEAAGHNRAPSCGVMDDLRDALSACGLEDET